MDVISSFADLVSGPILRMSAMELEFHRINLKYEGLRKRDPHKERRIQASICDQGQICPVVVLAQAEGGQFVLLDGYKRIRALKRLRHDGAMAIQWEMDEVEALLLERLMRSSPIEDWRQPQ